MTVTYDVFAGDPVVRDAMIMAWVRAHVEPYLEPSKEPYYINCALLEACRIIVAAGSIPADAAAFFTLSLPVYGDDEERRRVSCELLALAFQDMRSSPPDATAGALLAAWLRTRGISLASAVRRLDVGSPGQLLRIIHGRCLFPLDLLDAWSTTLGLSRADRLQAIELTIARAGRASRAEW